MKTLFVLAAFMVSFSGVAQLRKVESNFRKGDFDRCLRYCQQTKPGRDPEEYCRVKYYECRSYLALYHQAPAKVQYLDRSVFSGEIAGLLVQTLRTATDSLHRQDNKALAKKYLKLQAAQFKDTSALYALYFPPVEKPLASPAKGNAVPEKEKVSQISRKELLQYSEQFLNIPYKWAGEDSSGFDCSGLVTKVFRRFGYTIAHGAKDQSEVGKFVTRQQLKPGDLIFFGKKYDTGRCKIDHVAIVHETSGDLLRVIHSTSRGVNIQELKPDDYWGKKILFYKNVIDHLTITESSRL